MRNSQGWDGAAPRWLPEAHLERALLEGSYIAIHIWPETLVGWCSTKVAARRRGISKLSCKVLPGQDCCREAATCMENGEDGKFMTK
eukprot:1052930-Pelagomonas_calceolata.AAC.2